MPMQGNPWMNPDQQGGGQGGGYDSDTLDWLKKMGLFGGLGQAAGGAFGMFNQGKNPADSANEYLNKIPGSYGDLNDEYGKLMHGDVYDRLAGGYKQSPGYKYQLDQAMAAGNNAAAAGGKLGTLGHQQLSEETAQGIASQDFDKYMQGQLGLYGQGLGGSQDYANALSNMYGQQAQYGYAGQAGKNQARGSNIGDIFGGIGGALGSLGGGPLGGAAGGGIGKWIGHLFGR